LKKNDGTLLTESKEIECEFKGIVLLAETDNDLKNTANILLKKGEKIDLKINETKTKYMIISRQNHRTDFLKVNDYKFERVRNFKYLVKSQRRSVWTLTRCNLETCFSDLTEYYPSVNPGLRLVIGCQKK